MKNILETKCGMSSCHAPGGTGIDHWTYYPEYDSVFPHLDHMYESALVEGEMPPDTAVALTEDEKHVFECWKKAGFPQ